MTLQMNYEMYIPMDARKMSAFTKESAAKANKLVRLMKTPLKTLHEEWAKNAQRDEEGYANLVADAIAKNALWTTKTLEDVLKNILDPNFIKAAQVRLPGLVVFTTRLINGRYRKALTDSGMLDSFDGLAHWEQANVKAVRKQMIKMATTDVDLKRALPFLKNLDSLYLSCLVRNTRDDRIACTIIEDVVHHFLNLQTMKCTDENSVRVMESLLSSIDWLGAHMQHPEEPMMASFDYAKLILEKTMGMDLKGAVYKRTRSAIASVVQEWVQFMVAKSALRDMSASAMVEALGQRNLCNGIVKGTPKIYFDVNKIQDLVRTVDTWVAYLKLCKEEGVAHE